jgi:hypothetical protein
MIETILRERNPSAVLPGDAYLAVGMIVTPYIAIYKKNGDTFTRLSSPATLPTGIVYGVVWNGSTHLCCSHANYPYVTVYKRAGDTFTKLANFTTNEGVFNGGRIAVNAPPGTGVSTKMAYTFSNNPGFKTVQISGDTFSVDANSGTSLASTPLQNTQIMYNYNSGSGDYLAVANQGIFIFTQGNPPVVISQSMPTSTSVRAVATTYYDTILTYGDLNLLRIAGTSAGPTFSTYSPASLSYTLSTPQHLAWDGWTGQFLASAVPNAGVIVKLWDTGSSFVTCTISGTKPTGGSGVAWSYSSILYLAVVSNVYSPYLYIYKQNAGFGTTFTKLSDPAVPLEGGAYAAAFSDPV